ncbi:hypothetical protein chiPu_0025469 [Chiloscyllium punctatum]|uniref:Uncharacterized protein n=1 Tax=Chiloscyllium punctatum TaxID=137246 RepID=A0A401TEK5_CHIPU|nr:hypothetical protein [Chiloscyllium punctatum]
MEGPGLAGGKNAKAAVPHPLSKDVLGFEEDDDDDDLEVFSKQFRRHTGSKAQPNSIRNDAEEHTSQLPDVEF